MPLSLENTQKDLNQVLSGRYWILLYTVFPQHKLIEDVCSIFKNILPESVLLLKMVV